MKKTMMVVCVDYYTNTVHKMLKALFVFDVNLLNCAALQMQLCFLFLQKMIL